MIERRVSETLRNAIAPLLPEPKPSPEGGRPLVSDRACLEGIIFVLRSGIPRQMLPTELGYGSGSTCWRRLRAWMQLEVWPKLRQRLLRVLGRRERINLERAVIDSASMRAIKGGAHTGPDPTDRGKKGCKRHVVTDADGIPLVVRTGPAHQLDAAWALEMLDAIPPCSGRRSRPRRRTEDVPRRWRVRDQSDCGGGGEAAGPLPAGALRQGRAKSMGAGWVRPTTSSSGRSVGWVSSAG